MHVQRQPVDERLGEKRAGKRHDADQQRDRDHLGVDRAEHAEHADLDDADDHRDRRVGRDHGGALQADRHQHREQDDAGAAGAADHDAPDDRRDAEPALAQREPVAPREAAQRHAQHQHAADHQHRAARR